MAEIQQRGKVRLGVREDDIVFGNKNPTTNRYEGFDIDLLREMAKALFGATDANVDNSIEFTPVVSASRIPSLQENKVDFVGATMTITEDRKKQIDFSDVYFRAGQRILVKKDNTTIKEVTDLNGKTVCAARGSTSEKNITEKAPQAKLLLLDTYVPCLTALQNAQADAVSTDDAILMGLVKRDPNTKLVGKAFSDEPYGIGMKQARKGLVDWANGLLKKMFDDGTWKKLYEKHIKPLSGEDKSRP